MAIVKIAVSTPRLLKPVGAGPKQIVPVVFGMKLLGDFEPDLASVRRLLARSFEPVHFSRRLNSCQEAQRFRSFMKRFNPTAPAKAVISDGLIYQSGGRSVHKKLAAGADLAPGSQQLIVGGIGSGKTTELLLAQAELAAQPPRATTCPIHAGGCTTDYNGRPSSAKGGFTRSTRPAHICGRPGDKSVAAARRQTNRPSIPTAMRSCSTSAGGSSANA